MDKRSSEGKPCVKCGELALPGTNPPLCEEHLKTKQASSDDEPATLKELEWTDTGAENGSN